MDSNKSRRFIIDYLTGVGAIDGLRRMNIFLSLHEKDALVHYWSLVGHLIGMNSKLNPIDYKNAKKTLYRY